MNLIECAHTAAGEDVVAFYHKHFSAYLSYDPSLQAAPMYYQVKILKSSPYG